MADSIVRRERRPMHRRAGVQDLMDMWFDDMFESSLMARIQPFEWRTQEFGPTVDVIEREDKIIVNAEVPGMNPEDIDISMSGNAISISGEKRSESEQEMEGRRYSERSYGSFCRVIPMPPDVDRDKVEARFKHGLLTVTIPKSQTAIQRTKKIQIKTEFSEASAAKPTNRQDIETMGAEDALQQMENPPGEQQFSPRKPSKDTVTQQPAAMQDLETVGAEEAIQQMEQKGTVKKSK